VANKTTTLHGNSSARTEVLRRIQAANGGPATETRALEGWDAIERSYVRSSQRNDIEKIELLEDRLRDYDAHVVRAEPGGVAQAVQAMLSQLGCRRILIPAGLSTEWLPGGFEFVQDQGGSAAVLDGFDGVLTGSTLAIAETGTIVLQNAPGQGRRALTLVPDYHLCLVRTADIVETVPEAMALLESRASLPTTFFSGPSATADIEMTRIKGVHGPRFLDVVLLG
jgi:L-lactate dehydrogenase complex protein LldG